METIKSNPNRLLYIDNLRAAMIILVVMIHTAVTYSGAGSWFYVENHTVDLASKIIFGIFQSFTQAFFMGLLFFFAGYFIQPSLERKGTRKFFLDRLFRLGVPTIIFILLLFPLCVKIVNPGLNLKQLYTNGIISLDFLSWTGPTWFTLLLLILTFIYFPFRKLISKINIVKNPFSLKKVFFLILLISMIAFILRLFFPIDSSFMNMQFSFFSSYIIMFIVGIIIFSNGLLDKITYKLGKQWLLLSLAIGIPLWMAIMLFGGPLQGIEVFKGGLNWQSFAFALWESFFCVTFSLGLIGVGKFKWNKQNTFQKSLTDNAFGVYVLHPPVLITISIILKNLILHPLIKFIFISILTIAATYLVSWLIRKIPFCKKVFS